MENSLVATLLATFSKEELREFLTFLARPERSVRKDVVKLAGLLCHRTIPSAESISHKLYPDKPFSQQQVNQLGSWLYAEAGAFLLERLWAKKNDELPLIREFDRRNLPRHRDRLRRRLQKQDLSAGTAYELESIIYATTQRTSRTETNNLQVINDHLDRDYLHKKLRQVCLMRSHENVFKVNYDMGLLSEVLSYLEGRKLTQDPVIGVYFHIYHFLGSPDGASHFKAFQELLPDLPPSLSDEEVRDLYLLGINYCIRQTNQGDQAMAREALRLYREGLNNGSLLENGRLTSFTYRNAVALSLKIKDFDWARDFIHSYAPSLPAGQREALLQYNLAKMAHAMGNPDKALEELRYVTSNDTLFTLTLDTLRAKIYHETGALDLLDAHLDKMHIFLRRKGDSYHHKNYANFIAFLKKILHLRPRPDEQALLEKAITEEPILTERTWLLETLGTPSN
ncbi:MAG: hypothetical protein AB8H12_10235 [Lewinella sp.]